jgi:hypothetical protein
VKKITIQSFEAEAAARKEIDFLRKFRHPHIIGMLDSIIREDQKGSRAAYILFPYMQRGRYITCTISKIIDF